MTIGIIGAGTMGTDVSQAFIQAGFNVILIDNNAQQFERVKRKIKTNLRFLKLYQPSLKLPDYELLMAKIQFSTNLEDLNAVEYIIENVTEDLHIKTQLHTQIDHIALPNTIVAVNTSAITITNLASLRRNPKNTIGVHFMNPAYVMPTVEVIRGYHTSESTIQTTVSILSSIGKKSIVVKDSPGFITNRAMMLFINEAVYCLHEGISNAQDIDSLFKECFGHKMGPLQTADLIGIDTILKSLQVLYNSFNDDKYRPCILLKQMVDAGLLGVKSGHGFYEYQTA